MTSKKVAFVYSHAMLFRTWSKAKEILAEQNIDVIVVSQMAALDWETFLTKEMDGVMAVYFDATRHFSTFDQILDRIQEVPLVVPGGMEAKAALPDYDKDIEQTVNAYLQSARVEDLVNVTKYLLFKNGVENQPAPPSKPVLCGIYHSKYDDPLLTIEEWMQIEPRLDQYIYTVAILFPRTSWLEGDLEAIDTCCRALEKHNVVPLPIFCDWELATELGTYGHPLGKLLNDCPLLGCIWNGLLSHAVQSTDEESPFAEFCVPVIQLIRNYTQTIEQWQESQEGLSPMTISFSMLQSEMMGCIEPTVFACNESAELKGISGMVSSAVPVVDQIEHLAKRTEKWLLLANCPNQDKRITIILNNSPCKSVEATLTSAAGLDAAQSTIELLRRLKTEGYTVDDIPLDGVALIQLFLNKKAISEFRWTNVEEIVEKGGVLEYVDRNTYNEGFDHLPDECRKQLVEAWGDFPGEAMVYHNSTNNPTLLVTGLKFGNVIVMIEPKRGCWGPKCDGEVCRILHQPDIPPPHHWMAVYQYIRKNSDALIHMGAESPLEYLPGKTAGLSQSCFAEISLGALPHLYPYIMNSTAEGLVAKRRGRGVLIDHLTPAKGRLDELNSGWDEMDELLRQYSHAKIVSDQVRHSRIGEKLRTVMEETGLIDQSADQNQVDEEIELLPRKLQSMRKRVVEVSDHVLGNPPEEDIIPYYLSEASWTLDKIDESQIKTHLQETTNEMEFLINALYGRFVTPGPSGSLSSGKIDVIPTGRNFYGMDLKMIPTESAFEIGSQMGQQILCRYLKEENQFPETIGISLWSSDVFQADGELTSQILWLIGCRPTWKENGQCTGVEVIPVDQLILQREDGKTMTRPRVDIVIHMSGIVRDTLPNIYQLLDSAISEVSLLDEPREVNFIRTHVDERLQELSQEMESKDQKLLRRLGTARIFSSKPGSYGDGVNLAIDASAWETDNDLAETFINWTGYAYGNEMNGVPDKFGDSQAMFKQYSKLLKKVDIAYQRACGPEYDALSINCYSGFQGGMATAKRAMTGKSTKMYWGDTVTTSTPEVRDLSEEFDLSLSTKLLNNEWISRQKKDGYRGAATVSTIVNALFAWSATSRLVTKKHFDGVMQKFVENEDNKQWLAENNVYALEEITRRLLEASSRKLWEIDDKQQEILHQVILEVEGNLEDQMGSVKGEFQGGSVDIKTRENVEEWKYEFTLE